MKQNMMVVEDDQMIRELIVMYLEKEGYDVIEAANGEEAKEKFLLDRPCLIILDLMLPKLSGEEFCKWVKEEGDQDVSIIILSAKTRVEDKLNVFNMGADDYMVKPFEPEELVAHVKAVLRRTGQFCQKLVHKGLCLKPLKGEVWLFNDSLSVTQIEFKILQHMMENPNLIITREDLINHIYPNTDQTILDRTIDAHIKKLRKKIEKDPANPDRILTVRGWGYKFSYV
ncbi:MAG TPA: response regulator transcription factor [Pseudogracilibacillus sp.]|nr:response regulator transcription factor [Pseudogracilibacillus sp.]